MEIQAGNMGLVVVSLDGCLSNSAVPVSVPGSENSMKNDCMYTVTVMAPDGIVVSANDPSSCLHETLPENPQINTQLQQDPASINDCDLLNNEHGDYYNNIIRYLTGQLFPENANEAMRTLISRKARHYCVISGQLYYGHKNPKQVVCDKEMRLKLMHGIHINASTGVHIGVQKMHSQLKKDYFWCGMYMDLSKFVRQCHACVDAELVPASVKMLANKRRKSTELETYCAACRINSSNKVWKKVELRLSGPYSNKFLLTIADPVSHWIEAQMVTSTDLATQTADFLMNTFRQLGFASFTAVGFTPDLRVSLQNTYLLKFSQLIDKLSPDGIMMTKMTDCSEDQILCPWVTDFLKSIMKENPENWSTNIAKHTFEYRVMSHGDHSSPFNIMFDRCIIQPCSEEDKENSLMKHQIRSATQRFKHQQGYSKTQGIATRLLRLQRFRRQRAAALAKKAAAKQSTSEDEDDPPVMLSIPTCDTTSDSSSDTSSVSIPERTFSNSIPDTCTNTVAAVQAVLSATREERSRRGHYQKYSVELREEIASYALKHGSLATSKCYSEKLDTPISESTIRNFVKRYQVLSPELQLEIGEYTMNHSLKETAHYFSAKLGRTLGNSQVRRSREKYISRFAKSTECHSDPNSDQSRHEKYPVSLEDDYSHYATHYTMDTGVSYYNTKMQSPSKDTVKIFKKDCEEKGKNDNMIHQPVTTVSQTIPQNETIDVVQASFNILNSSSSQQSMVYNTQSYQPVIFQQNQPTLDHSTVSYHQQSMPTTVLNHQTSLVLDQSTYQPHHTAAYTSNYTSASSLHLQTPVEQSPMLSDSTALSQQCRNSQMIIPQHSVLLTHSQSQSDASLMNLDNLTQLQGFDTQLPSHSTADTSSTSMNFLQPTSISYTSTLNSGQPMESASNNSNANYEILDNSGSSLVLRLPCDESHNMKLEELNPVSDSAGEHEKDPNMDCKVKTVSKSKSKKSKGKNRGNYTTYSPEIRAEIGKYAATNGNQKTIDHFRAILGHDLPESTVRGLKEKYLAKTQLLRSKSKETKNVTSLGFGIRGRPMRLGKYDEVVRRCIQNLVNKGEKVSSFLAITTAKQVLMQHEPELLVENGGNIKLTPNWAKSFLKRIGVHNNL